MRRCGIAHLSISRVNIIYTMPLTFEQLTAEAMRLPIESRVLLADRLVESLDSAETDEIQRLSTDEAIRRRDEVRSGRVKAIPGEQVLDEVRRLVGDDLLLR
jgi:putative addiction module component (TIGR02574 family)